MDDDNDKKRAREPRGDARGVEMGTTAKQNLTPTKGSDYGEKGQLRADSGDRTSDQAKGPFPRRHDASEEE